MQSDVDQVQYSSSSRDVKSFMSGKSQNSGSQKSAASDNRQGLRRSFSQNPVKYHDGYSVSLNIHWFYDIQSLFRNRFVG